MLLQATIIVDLIAMAATRWMAFYLFARGSLNTTTLRIVVVLLALSGFFFGAYDNIFVHGPGTAAIRAITNCQLLPDWVTLPSVVNPYGIVSLRSQPSAPRIIQDTLTFIGIFVLKIPLEQREMLCGDRPGGVSHDNPPMHFGRASLTFEEVTFVN